jgi:hypothetical protein
LIVPAAPAVEAPPLEAAPEISEVAVVLPVVEEATARKSAKKASKKSAEKFTITRDPKDVRTTRGADLVIKILTANGANPRKENTHARDHFEQMRGNPTVREYLARFPADARRTARQWLYNTIRDGHVKTEA